MFKCLTISLDEGFVIIDAERFKSDDNNIIYKKDYAYIYCRKTEYPFLHDTNAILCVNKSIYKDGDSHILTYAQIFINKRIEYKYKISFNIFEKMEIDIITELYKEYNDIYNKFILNKNEKYIKLFSNLFYPYKKNYETEKIKSTNNITIQLFMADILKNNFTLFTNKFLTFSPQLSLSSNVIIINDNNNYNETNLYISKTITIDLFNFTILLLKSKSQMLNFISHLNQLCVSDIKYYNNLIKQISHYENIKY